MESGMVTRREHRATSVDKSWKETSSGHLGKSLTRSLAEPAKLLGLGPDQPKALFRFALKGKTTAVIDKWN
jgi:hypothetical protein